MNHREKIRPGHIRLSFSEDTRKWGSKTETKAGTVSGFTCGMNPEGLTGAAHTGSVGMYLARNFIEDRPFMFSGPLYGGETWPTSRASRESNYEDDNTKYDLYLPVVTIPTDKTRAESTFAVLKQRSFTGRVLLSAVADTLCTSLNHVMEARAYDEELRRDLLEKKEIGNYAPPRRVWDLRANRVVPWWVVSDFKAVWGISHAWVADNDLRYEMTPINGYEWPVPMPKDANLDRIRIEMLNLGAEYVWLDVLCLRQKCQGKDPHGISNQKEWDRREVLRKEEWKVDLPIIGWVYHNVRQVACYLSGLGLPLSFKDPRDFKDERCWFNRAWTMPETPHNVVNPGRTHDDTRIVDERFMTRQTYRMLCHALVTLECVQQTQRRERRMYVLEEMKRHKSSKPVDKVAGLVFLLQLKRIPLYHNGQSAEGAWAELMNVADDQLRAMFLFLCPTPNGNGSWRPSWKQVMMETIPSWPYMILVDDVPNVSDVPDGLADGSPSLRRGTLNLKSFSGVKHTFLIFAQHACPIPDGQYTLLGVLCAIRMVLFCVVGKT
ncbi:hypothetical protein IW261DRAFT_1424819 [Armillaria novae-zelandiae]|uniref:Heterokaryon incompatibility domain-containing protein n=1 Tax=Armillaria novae-zelandiae TaxID=153914 RepID=A0AA39NU24_9AGAR|nr:hypothetical protein IW261DRAFT_1424819 [Armillaria novae-zelandiae]